MRGARGGVAHGHRWLPMGAGWTATGAGRARGRDREERVPRVTIMLAEDFPAGPFGPGGPGRPGGHGGPGGPGGRPMRPDFFAVRQLIVSRQPDGTLAATPVRREDGVAVDSRANAFYRFRPQPDQPKPHAGDQIEVELRWPYAL